jgi:hypothetical protein
MDQKTVLAALLAVRHGLVSPEQAMKLVQQARDGSQVESGALETLASAAQNDRYRQQLDAAVVNPREALRDMGVAPQVVETLLQVDVPQAALHETLLAVAPSGGPEHTPSVKSTADRYEVKSEHARGGMGRILIALDRTLDREVALKELLPQSAISGAPATPSSNTRDTIERFLREAKVTGKLEHPNIVPVYEIGQREDGSIFYTMKFVRGRTLASALKEVSSDRSYDAHRRLAARLRFLGACQDVCNAIAYAHSRGVIHRDLKPANIMLGDFGETLVLDWGLARLASETPEQTASRVIGRDAPELTVAGSVMGTPAYMAP